MVVTLIKYNCISILFGTVCVSAQGASQGESSPDNLERVWTGTKIIQRRWFIDVGLQFTKEGGEMGAQAFLVEAVCHQPEV